MTRKIKRLGLAFVAVAAMSMVAAVGAQAAQLHAATGGGNARIAGTQTTQHSFTIDAGIVKCGQATFNGVVAPTANDGEVTARYTQCNISGIAAVVDMNGCKYTITGTGQPAKEALVDITGCTAGTPGIVVTSATCTVTVPEQTGLSKLVFTNLATHVTAAINVGNIKYQTHGTCPNTTSDHTSQTTNGAYTGSATFEAFKNFTQQQVTHNGHQLIEAVGGEKVSLQAT